MVSRCSWLPVSDWGRSQVEIAKVCKHKWIDNSNGKNFHGYEGSYLFAEAVRIQVMNDTVSFVKCHNIYFKYCTLRHLVLCHDFHETKIKCAVVKSKLWTMMGYYVMGHGNLVLMSNEGSYASTLWRNLMLDIKMSVTLMSFC
ncbi:hypothetical protein STEG23_031687 [Scotinomys teguina]